MGRFLNADAFASTGQGILGNNMFAYCGNNPIVRKDSGGTLWDYVVDWVFILWGLYDTVKDPSLTNIACLVVDVVFAVIPFIPSGVGQIIKIGDKIKDGIEIAKKASVVGETMDRVRDFAKSVNALDNLYDGFRLYKDLAKNGNLGKVAAEIGGKLSNAAWLFSKLRSGYTIYDIGIDASRAVRSSSYALEEIILFLWETRNTWKTIINQIEEE